jgi:hypothetical protein
MIQAKKREREFELENKKNRSSSRFENSFLRGDEMLRLFYSKELLNKNKNDS